MFMPSDDIPNISTGNLRICPSNLAYKMIKHNTEVLKLCLCKRYCLIMKSYTVFMSVVGLNPIKGPCCFLVQETLPFLLSTGRFQ